MAAMNEKDYYAVLGVSEDATTDEIRKAFQQKARKLHPDVNKAPDAEPDEILATVMGEINRFMDGEEQFDDITMLCLKYNGPVQ